MLAQNSIQDSYLKMDVSLTAIYITKYKKYFTNLMCSGRGREGEGGSCGERWRKGSKGGVELWSKGE